MVPDTTRSERSKWVISAWLRHSLRRQHDSGTHLVRLDLEEIRASFAGEDYPPILTLDQAAALAGWASGTLKRKVSQGMFKSSVRRRRRPLLFWRDKFVQELMK